MPDFLQLTLAPSNTCVISSRQCVLSVSTSCRRSEYSWWDKTWPICLATVASSLINTWRARPHTATTLTGPLSCLRTAMGPSPTTNLPLTLS